jgi:hypothetical protein
MGVNGRPTRAWALSTDSVAPRCSDQLNESNAAQPKVEIAMATFVTVVCVILLPPFFLPHFCEALGVGTHARVRDLPAQS